MPFIWFIRSAFSRTSDDRLMVRNFLFYLPFGYANIVRSWWCSNIAVEWDAV